MADNVRQLPGIAETGWSQAQRDLVKKQVCPKGITDDEFDLFMHQCIRSGLDPLLKQAFCVPRRQNIAPKGQPEVWVEKREFQASESGMLARAERFPDFRGVTASVVRANDKRLIDAGEGKVSHTYVPGGERGEIVGAWARVVRENREPYVVWIEYASFKSQDGFLWKSMPGTMIEKCARVAALRKAYPENFGGLYIAEEMEDTGPVVEGTVTQKPAAPSKAELVKGKLTAKLQAENQAAKVSRLTIQDESKTPDRVPAANSNPPSPSQAVVDAPKVAEGRREVAAKSPTPYDQLAELAAAQATTARELIERAGLVRRTKGDVTAADVAAIRELLAKTEPPPPEDLIE